MNVKKTITLSIFFVGLPVIIYFYFLQWKTHSIHDDDLFIFKNYTARHGFFQRLNVSTDFGQFRPVRDLFLYFEIQSFGRNTDAFYLINVFIHSVNTVLFAFVLNLVFRSLLMSFGLSLVYGLSRYSFYNLTQLFNGAPLEGLAMTFFLLCLYQIVKIAVEGEHLPTVQRRQILLSILAANLAMYTHERYIALFPFLLFFITLFPSIRLSRKNKAALGLLVVLSPIVNGVIKTFFSLRIFMGTAYVDVKFSLVDAINHYFAELISIFQFNLGAEYLVGLPYERLSVGGRMLIVICAVTVAILFFVYAVRAIVLIYTYNRRESETLFSVEDRPYLILFVYLFVLLSLLIGPAVVQIRMELRWLQAPLCVFLVMIAIVLVRTFKERKVPMATLYLLVVLSYVYTNLGYVYDGAKNLYYSTSARIGDAFDTAIKKGVIQNGKSKLYIWEKKRDEGREGEVNWALNSGYFFSLYQLGSVNLVFVDSLYSRKDSSYTYSFPNFDSNKEQIIFLDIQNDDQTFKYSISNLTNAYITDSLKTYIRHYN